MNADKKNTPLTIAQFGCGYWGPNLLRNFSRQNNCQVKWLAELDPKRRAYVEENFPKTQTTDQWEKVISDPEVDGVVIATAASTHYDLVKRALNEGKHVFVEKPLTTRTEEADELVKLAEKTKRTLMVGHTFLYNPAVRYIRGVLNRGDLGSLYYIYSQRLNLGQVRKDVNAWWNLAPHDVSILLYLMDGELPTSVMAQGADYIQSNIEDVSFVTLTWVDKVIANIHVSWLDPAKTRKMTLVGTRQMLVYDDIAEQKVTILDKGVDRVPTAGTRMDYDHVNDFQLLHRKGDIWMPQVPMDEPLKLETAHFLDCIRSGEEPLTGPKHARDVVAVLEAGDQALKTGRRVMIRPFGNTEGIAIPQRVQTTV